MGSNPATPTEKHQVSAGAERSAPGLICFVASFWEPFGSRPPEPAPPATPTDGSVEEAAERAVDYLRAGSPVLAPWRYVVQVLDLLWSRQTERGRSRATWSRPGRTRRTRPASSPRSTLHDVDLGKRRLTIAAGSARNPDSKSLRAPGQRGRKPAIYVADRHALIQPDAADTPGISSRLSRSVAVPESGGTTRDGSIREPTSRPTDFRKARSVPRHAAAGHQANQLSHTSRWPGPANSSGALVGGQRMASQPLLQLLVTESVGDS